MPGKHKMIWLMCDLCKKPFTTRRADYLRRGNKHCGKRCATYSHISVSAKKNISYGAENGNWQGGKTLHQRGYVYTTAPDHPRQHNGYVFEHIIVAEKMLGRHLNDSEVVHHKNGDRADNRPENLKVFSSTAEHTRYHARDLKRGERGRWIPKNAI